MPGMHPANEGTLRHASSVSKVALLCVVREGSLLCLASLDTEP